MPLEQFGLSFLSQTQAGFILVIISVLGYVLLILGDKKLNNYLKGQEVRNGYQINLLLDFNNSIFNGIKLNDTKVISTTLFSPHLGYF